MKEINWSREIRRKLRELRREYIQAVLLMTVFGVIGGSLIIIGNVFTIVLGIICIFIDIVIEAYYLQTVDVREPLKLAYGMLDDVDRETTKLRLELEQIPPLIATEENKIVEFVKEQISQIAKFVDEQIRRIGSYLEGM